MKEVIEVLSVKVHLDRLRWSSFYHFPAQVKESLSPRFFPISFFISSRVGGLQVIFEEVFIFFIFSLKFTSFLWSQSQRKISNFLLVGLQVSVLNSFQSFQVSWDGLEQFIAHIANRSCVLDCLSMLGLKKGLNWGFHLKIKLTKRCFSQFIIKIGNQKQYL